MEAYTRTHPCNKVYVTSGVLHDLCYLLTKTTIICRQFTIIHFPMKIRVLENKE